MWDAMSHEYKIKTDRPFVIPCRGNTFLDLPIKAHVPQGHYGMIDTTVGTPLPTEPVVHLDGNMLSTLANLSLIHI